MSQRNKRMVSHLLILLFVLTPVCTSAQDILKDLTKIFTGRRSSNSNEGNASPKKSGGPKYFVENYLRALAKDKPQILLITSGTDSRRVAEVIQKEILAQPDFKGNRDTKVRLLSFAEAAKSAGEKDFDKISHLFLLNGEEFDQIPSELTKWIPEMISKRPMKVSVGQGEVTVRKPGDLAHNIVLYVPGGDHLTTLYEEMKSQRFEKWGDIRFKFERPTKRVLVFSAPANKARVIQWGISGIKDAWESSEWHSFSEYASLPPSQWKGCDLAFFVSRSNKENVLPDPVKNVLGNTTFNDTVTVLRKQQEEDETRIAVFSAPTPLLLEGKASAYPSMEQVPEDLRREEAKDLRFIKDSSLVVVGAKLNNEQKEQIRSTMQQLMRDRMEMNVREQGLALNALDEEGFLNDFKNGASTAEELRRRFKSPYVWVFQVLDFSGSTSYKATETPLTAPMERPSAAPPQRPVRQKGESSQDYAAEVNEYNQRLALWRDAQLKYRTEPCEWDCQIIRIETGRVRGVLKLFNLEDSTTPVWARDIPTERATQGTVIQNEKVTVRGHEIQAQPLPKKPNEDDCSEKVKLGVAEETGLKLLGLLMGSARLLTQGEKPTELKGRGELPITPPTGPYVRRVAEGVISVQMLTGTEFHVGETLSIFRVDSIIDPVSGKPVEERVKMMQAIVERIEEKTAYCVPATKKDQERLAQIRGAMPVRKDPSTNKKPLIKKPSSNKKKG